MLSAHSKADCEFFRFFKETYLWQLPRENIFFIKGVALEVFEYGRTIKVIEDLKGNFVGGSSIFVWGASGFDDLDCIISERSDNITLYQENDTLIMIIGEAGLNEECIETSSEYATMACSVSVLKLADGFVTGHISWWGQTMSWEEFQTLLTTSIQSVKAESKVYQQGGTIFFDNIGKKAVKLSFYDLFGKLVHETITISNNYRPALAGSIFICKININDEFQIIKYIAP